MFSREIQEKAIEQYLKALEIEGTTFGDKLMVHGIWRVPIT